MSGTRALRHECLVEFLNARLNEDAEEIAKHPDGEDDWEFIATGEHNYPCTPYLMIGKKRAIAEVEAKRRIMAEHSSQEVASLDRETWGQVFVVCRRCRINERQVAEPCLTLRALALPYVDHPDYREEWRPE